MRRALRVADNGPLWNALRDGDEVFPCVTSRDGWCDNPGTPRHRFLQEAVGDLESSLRRMGSALFLIDGAPLEQFPRAAASIGAEALFVGDPAGPAERRSDAALARALSGIGCRFISVPDSGILGDDDILTAAGTPYTVFTPYKRAWLLRSVSAPPAYPVDVRPLKSDLPAGPIAPVGVTRGGGQKGGETAALYRLGEFSRNGIGAYGNLRDLPGVDGTSRLSADLANGTISARTVFHAARQARSAAGSKAGADAFIGELVWREFYRQILRHFPRVATGPFREEYAGLEWSRKRTHFNAWCEGRTGYPLVDAGMRQLNAEGWMHNRVRMVAASFLTKDLHIDWRWGERYFLERLVDADPASNNGGWQWSAGTGTDAAPYFRVFNPVAQGRRCDPAGVYVRRYLPELANVPGGFIHSPWEMGGAAERDASFRVGKDYPPPIVDHAGERSIALTMYRKGRRRTGA